MNRYTQEYMQQTQQQLSATNDKLALILLVDNYPEDRQFDIGYQSNMSIDLQIWIVQDLLCQLVKQMPDQTAAIALCEPLLNVMMMEVEKHEPLQE